MLAANGFTYDALRTFAGEYCATAMNLTPSEPMYRVWTGGRDPGPVYSSCADLAHCVLWLLGCREPWVNVAENGGFRSAPSVNLLLGSPTGKNPFAHRLWGNDMRAAGVTSFALGDVLVLWPDGVPSKAHVCVFSAMVPDRVRFWCWNFGQGPTSSELWRGGRSHIESAYKAQPLDLVQWRLPFERVPFTAPPILPSGEVFDAMDRGTFTLPTP